MSATRSERDSLGPIEVPADRLWGAQTERSRRNFRISGERMPLAVIHALALIKRCAARVNRELGLLEASKAAAIQQAADEGPAGRHGLGPRALVEPFWLSAGEAWVGAPALQPDAEHLESR